MDLSLERDSSALGSLFQQIINDMKNTSPLWEDFVAKAGKLHTCLRAAIQAIAAYLDAFQKIADAATNSRGASKEIGTALTRVCLRHKAVETRLKTFTSAIMDCLVQPLQERIEDWKRTVATIDKDHAKEYKRCRTELKKRSSDTLRLQKKARKGQTDGLQSLMDSHMQDVTLRRAELEEVEKKSLRSAMVEERLRYCSFVHMLQPVVHEECEVMSELGHLQEAMQSIALVTKEPSVLPQASEELIHDAKASINLYPESPGGGSGSQGGGCSNSLGSRKSSVCSISSMNSSGSSNSPGHHHYPRSLSQFVTPAIRLKPGESSDSGFCSSPALTTQTSNATNQTANVSTWPPHSQDGVDTLPPTADRPHTISTAYEKGHQRPPLTVYTFQNPETIHESGSCLNNGTAAPNGQPLSGQATPATQKSPAASLSRPPLPVKPAHVRCSSLERPLSAQSNHRQGSGSNLLQRQCPSPIPAHITKELSAAHHAQQQQQQQQNQNQQPQTPPTYVNMSELATMAALKQTNQQQKTSTPPLQQQSSIDSTCSQHSNDSTGSHQLLQQQQQHQSQQNHHSATATRSHSISSTASSLHSHPSIDSTVACGSLVGQHNHSTSTNTNTNTTSPSSGSSTPQNHYSPLLTNSPTSTAAGTPSGSSLGPGSGLGFVYQVSSPTPPSSEVLKITEQGAAGQDQGTGSANSVADEMDERSRASVLQKASMFEKAAAAAAVAVSPPASIQVASSAPASGGGTRRSEAEQQEMGGAASGGSTRIGRRASINQAKPPPPVRRSSSVTPSPNASVGTFRTSSPAAGGGGGGSIYAQPKLVNSMSSFRTSSPSPNGHAHPLPPTQPKANPNLIAQLNARLSGKQQQQQQQQQQVEGIYGNQQTPGGESIYMRSGLPMSQPQQQQHYDAAAQSPNMRQAHSHQHHQQPQQHYTCPPPLEDPPPPPIYAASASATMPKKVARPPTGQNTSHSSAYAAASSTATLPRNMMQHQQRLQQQQQQQYQQPASIGIGIGNGNGHLGQRPQLPLPQQKLRAAQQQHLAEQQQHQPQQQHQLQHQQHQQHQQRQPPIPSRHSSVQQKIFVSTNPFIQTTAVKFHSPSASPTCGSPVTGSGSGSLASIYATTSRGGHHHQQQQQQQQQQAQQQHYYRDAAGGNSNGGAAYYNHNAHAHSPAHHPNYATSTNIEKTGSIRAKTKAEFLENLNAKLAKQGMSGRAFAVRNLINSKALMYQNPQKLSRPSAQYRRPPTYPNTSTSTNATCEDQC
ncbi:pneumococcal serine-rich repeat protein isoform X30 [Drosophila santomea]|uniref:pneumococcal serine-rich repeat protein isoform X30 n=1 Tax=Drosophila santomea TaxID=129105 RepID=UPI001CCA4850|nr:pneumococcal serine-rich repeat protein isoform X30 [Drosophila santomea]